MCVRAWVGDTLYFADPALAWLRHGEPGGSLSSGIDQNDFAGFDTTGGIGFDCTWFGRLASKITVSELPIEKSGLLALLPVLV